MSKYYCSKCEGFHSKGKKFKEHKEFEVKLTSQELWKLQFKRTWKNYSIESHTKTYGSNKQIQKSNFTKLVSK